MEGGVLITWALIALVLSAGAFAAWLMVRDILAFVRDCTAGVKLIWSQLR